MKQARTCCKNKPHLQERSGQNQFTSAQLLYLWVHKCKGKCRSGPNQATSPEICTKSWRSAKIKCGWVQNLARKKYKTTQHNTRWNRLFFLFNGLIPHSNPMPTKAEAYIYQAAQPSIRSMGHMHLAKSYGANITDRFLCKYGFVYQAAQSISRSMGHMQLTKSYGTGEHSSYQLLPVSSGTVLAPVSCEDGSTFFAIKNDELPGFDQNAALWGFNLDYSIICVWNFTQKKGHAEILHGACTK